MAVKSAYMPEKKAVVIEVDGRFDFSVHNDVRSAYKNITEPGILYSLVLTKTSYMDSSALGMMLLLLEHAKAHQGDVEIKKPSPETARVLRIANFNKIFKIID